MQVRRLKIKDFGPVRDLELFFEPNKVYHFMADNDNGKSMVIDALKTVCCNMSNNQIRKYVSDYADHFSVEVEDFDGNIVRITRGPGLSEYYLKRADGTEEIFDKTGIYVPDEIQRIVNVYVDSERDENFNIRTADDKIVFTNTSPAENYSYFQKALGTDRLRESIKINNKIIKTVKAENDIIIGTIEIEKKKLDDYEDLSEDKRQVHVYVDEVKKSYELYSKVKRLQDLTVFVEQEVASLPVEISELDKNKLYNEVKDVERLRELQEYFTKYGLLRIKTAKIDEIIAVDTELKELAKDLELVSKYEERAIEASKSKKLSLVSEEMKELKKDYEDTLETIKLLDKIVEFNRLANLRDVELSRLDSLVTELSELKELREDLGEVYKLTESLSNTRDKIVKLKEVEEEVKTKRLELDTFMKKNKFCPVVAKREDLKCPFSNKRIEELGGITG